MKVFDKIAEFGQKLALNEDVENAVVMIADEAKMLLNAERCSIFIVDEEDGILWTKLSDGIGRIVIGLDSGIVGDTYAKKEPQIVNNPYEDERFLQNIDKKSGFVTRNIITVPIYDSKRNIMSVMQLLNKVYGDFDNKDVETLNFFANYVSGALELALLKER